MSTNYGPNNTDDEREALDLALWNDRPSNAGLRPEVTVSAELYEVLCRIAHHHFATALATRGAPTGANDGRA